MAHNNKHCPGINGKCSKIMSYWDNHSVCRACRNYACSPTSTWEVCADWSEELWKKKSKCLHRASQTKAFKPRSQTSSQVPENGAGRSCPSHVPAKDLGKDSSSLFRGSTSVSSATISTTEASDLHQLQQGMSSSAGEDSLQGCDGEPDRDSLSRDPSPDCDLSVDQGLGSRPVSPRKKGSSRNSLPRQDVQPRTGASGSDLSHHSGKRRRSSSDYDSSWSDVSRGRSKHKHSKSRHRSRSLSRPRHSRHHHRMSRASRSRSRHYRYRSSRSGSRFRLSRSKQHRHKSRSGSRLKSSEDHAVSA